MLVLRELHQSDRVVQRSFLLLLLVCSLHVTDRMQWGLLSFVAIQGVVDSSGLVFLVESNTAAAKRRMKSMAIVSTR